MPTVAGTGRALRDSPFGKIAILAVVLLAALLVSKSCGKTDPGVSQERAIEIAKGAVDFTPDRVQVRLMKRGLKSQEHWAVSLSTLGPKDELENVTVIVVDGDTGEIVEIRKQAG
jgi:hypothetical protein